MLFRSFASYLDFMRVKRKVDAEKLTLKHMGRKNVIDYLDWLQADKSSSVSTRNQRLAAIHAFCRYMQYEDVTRLYQWQEILGVKMKKAIKGTMNYLTMDAVKELLAHIPQTTMQRHRNLAMLSLLYNSLDRKSVV